MFSAARAHVSSPGLYLAVPPGQYALLVGNLLTEAMNKAAEIQAPLVDAAIVADAKRKGA